MAARGDYLLAIDQGTTGTTVLVLNRSLNVLGRGYSEIPQIYPRPGEVEHDPAAIWGSVTAALAAALRQASVSASGIAAIGITNQRETTLLWERATGKTIGNAIVWQDRRTAPVCEAMKEAGLEPRIRERTGLVLDPYFSGTKLRFMLEATPGLRARAERGEIAFGTVDSFLIWRLSGGKAHVTDASNASRTLLFDLDAGSFTDELCRLFDVPAAVLPEVRGSAEVLAVTADVPGLPDGIPIAGVAGDQQAALYGQSCLDAGDAKCTFGTGAFLLMNVGETPLRSRNGLLGTVAWRIDGKTTYALEGSAFVAGALIQWLRDGLGIIRSAAESEELARSVPDTGGVMIVPALVGLGAPHWRPEARGLISGLTRGTTKAHLCRAALEAIALQNVDLATAMQSDAGRSMTQLRVDGGAAANDLLMQLQADFLGVTLFRPDMIEATALGAAKLAARGVGLEVDSATSTTTRMGIFNPTLDVPSRASLLERWRQAVGKA